MPRTAAPFGLPAQTARWLEHRGRRGVYEAGVAVLPGGVPQTVSAAVAAVLGGRVYLELEVLIATVQAMLARTPRAPCEITGIPARAASLPEPARAESDKPLHPSAGNLLPTRGASGRAGLL
jgi:hypothetical protein